MSDSLIAPDFIMGGPNGEFDATNDASGSRDQYHMFNAPEWDLLAASDDDMFGQIGMTLGETLRAGMDWREAWECWSMSESNFVKLRPRINSKIERKFYARELNNFPYKKWENEFLSTLEDSVEQYGPLYDELMNHAIDIRDTGLSESEVVQVDSAYPQARIRHRGDKNQLDYASTSIETGTKSIAAISQLDGLLKLQQVMLGLDAEILKSVSKHFTQISYMR